MSKLRRENELHLRTSLFSAVHKGCLEKTREIISSFELASFETLPDGYVLLRDALQLNYLAVAVLLLTSGAKVNSKSIKPSNTPLHYAVHNGIVDIVKMILDKGANIHAINGEGRTSLYNAIERNKIELVELLIEHKADVNVSDNEGLSPLHEAAKSGSIDIIKHLLKSGANVNCECKKHYTPLHLAVKSAKKHVVLFLLSKGANVDSKADDNLTPLHIASSIGDVDISKVLLQHGACINSLTLEKGYTPLHFATELGIIAVVYLFLISGANINAGIKETPVHIAIKHRFKTILDLFLQHGPKVDMQDSDGKTILRLAVENGCLAIIRDILKFGPDNNNESNRSTLTIALKGERKIYGKIFKALQDYGIHVLPDDANNSELLHAAIQKGQLKITEDLLKYKADPNVLQNSDTSGFTPLHRAVYYKWEEIAKLLISYGADVNAQDTLYHTPIYYAFNNNDLKIIRILLSHKAIMKDSPDRLNVAVYESQKDIVEMLLQNGVDVNATDVYGRTALHCTTYIESGTKIQDVERQHSIKGEIAKLLLSKGANPDTITKRGETTLQVAIEQTNVKVVEALLEYNANVNYYCSSKTPLHLAAEVGNEEICRLLLLKGAQVNAKQEKEGYTPLHIATRSGYGNIVQLLLEFGANVQSETNSNITPLHYGAENGETDNIEILLKCGAKIDFRDVHGRSPLHIAAREGHVSAVACLLDHGSDINWTCNKNLTPLHYAMAGKRFSVDGVYVISGVHSMDLLLAGVDFRNCTNKKIAEFLKRYIIRMKVANLYVVETNLRKIDNNVKMNNYKVNCEREIDRMKNEEILPNISLYEIFIKCTRTLAMIFRNRDIQKALKAYEYYKFKYPLYSSMIISHIKRGKERMELLEQSSKILYFLHQELPYDCTEKIFSYLSIEDMRVLCGTGAHWESRGEKTNDDT